MDDYGFFKIFTGIVLLWALIVLAFWGTVIGVGIWALVHYGVL